MKINTKQTPGLRARITAFLSVKKNWQAVVAVVVGVELCMATAIVLLYFTMNDQRRSQAAVAPAAIACEGPELVIGAVRFPVLRLPRIEGSPVLIPPNREAMAYWVEDTGSRLIFGLSPAPEALALPDVISSGDILQLYWQNCPVQVYTIQALKLGQPAQATLLDAVGGDLRVFMQDSPAGAGFLIDAVKSTAEGEGLADGPQPQPMDPSAGQPVGATPALQENPAPLLPTSANTQIPLPDPVAVEAEIGMVEVLPSADVSGLQVRISIYNYNITDLALARENLRLLPPGGQPLLSTSANPALPLRIGPGQTVEITLIFPTRYPTNAVLQIYNVEFDLEGW